MLRLKSRRSREREGWPVVDGHPVEPYEIPPRPDLDHAELRRIEANTARERYRASTRFRRGVRKVSEDIKRRKGRGFERTFFRRWTVEYHRLPTSGGEKLRVEVYRARRWDFTIEFWRSL